MFKTILTVTIFIYTMQISYSQWVSVEDGGSGYIYEVKFKDENTGWYVMGSNLIYKTTNGGLNWFGIDIPNINDLGLLRGLINSGDTLWLPIDYQRIIKSTNGGINWFSISTNIYGRMSNLQLLNSGLMYGVSTYNYSTTSLVRSTNGGLNWDSIYTFGPIEIRKGIFCFINDSVGYSLGYYKLSKTTNGGSNWDPVYEDSTLFLDYLMFVNENQGFLVKNVANLFKTKDGGVSWNSIGYYGVKDMIFENENTGYMIETGDSSYFRKTTDGGDSWESKFSHLVPNTGRKFIDLEKVNNTFYIAAESRSGMFKSADGGNNWQNISKYESDTYCNSVDFINSQTGFIGGYHTGILQTTNSGLNWFVNPGFNQITNILERDILQVQFTSENVGWVSTDTGMLKTTNSGSNWFYLNNLDSHTEHFSFINNNTGWVLIHEGSRNNVKKLYKTTDSGLNFNLQYIINSTYLTDIQMYDSLFGFIVGDDIGSGTNLLRTTNGGNNWESFSYGSFNSLEIVDRKIAFIGGGTGTGIFKTTNGGDNWFKVFDSTLTWYDIKFINPNTGIAINYRRNMYYTTNSGVNWNYSNIGSELSLEGLYFNNMGLGFAVGSFNKIYRTTNYGGIVGINNNIQTLPSTFKLHQNYPNPFNPVTNIRFDIPRSSHVKLIIYDALGREVATLVNEKLNAGSYEVDWNGSGYPSGVYFYKLESSEFINIRKMVMIK